MKILKQKNNVEKINVVNDNAERAVVLIQPNHSTDISQRMMNSCKLNHTQL